MGFVGGALQVEVIQLLKGRHRGVMEHLQLRKKHGEPNTHNVCKDGKLIQNLE